MKRLSIENFHSEVADKTKLSVIKFFSPLCGPCTAFAPTFASVQANNKDIDFYEVDTMESPEIANSFGVRAVPCVVYCENNKLLYQFSGVTPASDLQFVIDNIDDEYFREHGEFYTPERKKSYWFEITLLLTVIFMLSLFIFL